MTAVVVIGDALLDVVAATAGRAAHGGDTPATISLEPGGQGANLAVRLARRGVGVRLVCALGTDMPGAILRERLLAEGVILDAATVPATGSVVVLVEGDGERTMLSQRVPVSIAAHDPPAAWTVVSGYCLLEPDALRQVAVIAEQPGRRAVIGCDVPPPLVEDWSAALQATRPDLLVLNAEEAAALAPSASDPLEHAAQLSAGLSAVVVVTDSGGAVAAIGPETVAHRAEPAAAVTDTTGAGDAFAAALIAELLDDAPWPPQPDRVSDALAEATRLARAVARTRGAQARVEGER
ncbi:MAG: carbohydrate kinase family protein [Candidatus Limnocylindria bacterium]